MQASAFAREQRDRAGDDPDGPTGDMQKQDQARGGEEPPGTSSGDVKNHFIAFFASSFRGSRMSACSMALRASACFPSNSRIRPSRRYAPESMSAPASFGGF